MALEIERKFLLRDGDFSWKDAAVRSLKIIQGHFRSTAEASVRVRICDGTSARLTIKGARCACTRPEFEYGIPVEDAQKMLQLFCLNRIIVKTRYYVPAVEDGLNWEIDEYHGNLTGFYNAELEIPDENFVFQRPSWLGEEVTGRPEYTNSALAYSQRIPEK